MGSKGILLEYMKRNSKLLKIAIDKNPVLKSNLIIQQKYFETKKSLLMLYKYTLEELDYELNKTLEYY